MEAAHVGIDFGTSNTAVATVSGDGQPTFLPFELLGSKTYSYRSLLFFDPEEQHVGRRVAYHTGSEAIEAYLEVYGEGRLVQSLKTHLTSQNIGRTEIGPHRISLDDMLRMFFERLREHYERAIGPTPAHIVLGRPVRFAGATKSEDNQMAQARLEAVARSAGFERVSFVLEPIAAAYHYERTLREPEIALVADFGGGTSDFCVMRLGPPDSRSPDRRDDILATGGVGIAGDDLDACLVQHVVCPPLGMGTTYVEMGREKPIPRSYYDKLSRWHQLSFLRGSTIRAELERLHRGAREPEALEALMHVIEDNLGFHLHKAVERTKIALSEHERSRFTFSDGPVAIDELVSRVAFEEWIAPKVEAITAALDETVERAGLGPDAIDRVFMTGGTAFVPLVRRAFEQRFGVQALTGGDELLSIASGLALAGAAMP